MKGLAKRVGRVARVSASDQRPANFSVGSGYDNGRRSPRHDEVGQPRHSATGVELRIADVSLAYRAEALAISHLSLSLSSGEFFSLVGPSGCGKSSLLRVVAGLSVPTAGTVAMEPELSHGELGIVFQDPTLLAWRDARRNVELPLELQKVPKRVRAQAADAVLSSVGLGDAVNRLPRELSGGMRMRVALARAAVCQPKLMLLDEPFAAVDEMTRERLQLLVMDMWMERRFTAIFVTHSVREAVFLAERVGVMTAAPGQLCQVIDVPLPFPRDDSVRTSPVFNDTVRLVTGALQTNPER